MEYTGLLFQYPINRLLTEDEWRGQLHQKKSLDVEPLAHFATVRLNSVYLEMVGKFFDWKGWGTSLMLGVLGGVLWALGSLVWIAVTRPVGYTDGAEDLGLVLGMGVLLTPMALFALWGITRDAFRLTHYPIRLNRKTRRLYAIDPRTLEEVNAEWGKMVFTLQPCKRNRWAGDLEILGHVMADDGATVCKTIPFSMVWGVREHLLRHWEYARRYMEEGPEVVFDHTPVCLPIAECKESYVFGLQVLMMNFAGSALMLVMAPLNVLVSLGRYVAMQTSRIPAWSAAVEGECVVEPADPYAIDSKNNPAKFWASANKRRSELTRLGLVVR